MTATTAAAPYGLDHHLFRTSGHPKARRWRQAATLEAEIGLRAAAWHDEPYDLANALHKAHSACSCDDEARAANEGRLL